MKNKISNIVIIILSTIIVAYIGLMVFGFSRPKAQKQKTASMHPDITQGSIVIAKKLNANEVFDELNIGSDIVFKTSSGNTLTHRVIMLDEANDRLQTQGIREGSTNDAEISSSNVLGKVSFSIPLIGYLVMLIQSTYFIILAICGIAIYVIVSLLIKQLKK